VPYSGTARGKRIDLDEPLPFSDGTRLRVEVAPESAVRKGSPRAVLELAGTLTEQEAEAILHAAQQCRQIDQSLWS